MRQGTTVLLRLFSSDPPSSATQVARLQHAVTTSTVLDPSGWLFFFSVCACVVCVYPVEMPEDILSPQLPMELELQAVVSRSV